MIINYSTTRQANLERTARIMRVRSYICIFKRCVRRGDYATNRAHVPMTMYARHCRALSSRAAQSNMLIDFINGLDRGGPVSLSDGRSVQISLPETFIRPFHRPTPARNEAPRADEFFFSLRSSALPLHFAFVLLSSERLPRSSRKCRSRE